MRFQLGSASRLVFSLAALGLAASAAHAQDLFVVNQTSNSISRYASTGPGTYSTTPTTITDPSFNLLQGIAVDARGDLFASSLGSNTITEFTAGITPGTFGAVTTLSFPNAPANLAVDAQGNLFVASFFTSSVYEFASTGAGTLGPALDITPYLLPRGTGVDGPNGLAVDASGNVFVSNGGSKFSYLNTITEIPSTGAGTFGSPIVFGTGPYGPIDSPSGLAFDTQGTLFVANNGGPFDSSLANNTVGAFSISNGTLSEKYNLSGGLNGPTGLAFDAQGNIFVANYGDNSITEFASTGKGTFGPAMTIETGLSGPMALAFGPSAPAAVPEASTTVSFGLLLTLGLGGVVLARRRKAA